MGKGGDGDPSQVLDTKGRPTVKTEGRTTNEKRSWERGQAYQTNADHSKKNHQRERLLTNEEAQEDRAPLREKVLKFSPQGSVKSKGGVSLAGEMLLPLVGGTNL